MRRPRRCRQAAAGWVSAAAAAEVVATMALLAALLHPVRSGNRLRTSLLPILPQGRQAPCMDTLPCLQEGLLDHIYDCPKWSSRRRMIGASVWLSLELARKYSCPALLEKCEAFVCSPAFQLSASPRWVHCLLHALVVLTGGPADNHSASLRLARAQCSDEQRSVAACLALACEHELTSATLSS